MDKEDLQSIYNTLSRFKREYYGSSGRTQSNIEERVRMFAQTLPGDLYVRLNQGSAIGLYRSSFFQGDLDRSLSILEKEIGK